EQPAGLSGRDLFQFWRHHPAGTAPCRPEIDHDGNRRLCDQPVEVGRLPHLDGRSGGREFLLAFGASRRPTQSLEGETVFLTARGARRDNTAIVRNEFHVHFLAARWARGGRFAGGAGAAPPSRSASSPTLIAYECAQLYPSSAS